jgi:hypothetical protein
MDEEGTRCPRKLGYYPFDYGLRKRTEVGGAKNGQPGKPISGVKGWAFLLLWRINSLWSVKIRGEGGCHASQKIERFFGKQQY